MNQSAVSDDALGGAGKLRVCQHRVAGTLRLWSAPAVARDFALREAELHRSSHRRSVLDLRFVEDNWDLGRIGGDSSDVKAGMLNGMFDFSGEQRASKLILDPSTELCCRADWVT